jgi:hypothetical protein
MSCALTPDLFPAQYDLPPVVSGNKWQGFSGDLTLDAETPPTACTDVIFQIHTSQQAQDKLFVRKYSASPSQITLNLTTWVFTVNPVVISLIAGTYYWSLTYLDTAGDPITVGEGNIIVNRQGYTP